LASVVHFLHVPLAAFTARIVAEGSFPFSSLKMNRISFSFGLTTAIEPGEIPP
jgi:hypothetical protein